MQNNNAQFPLSYNIKKEWPWGNIYSNTTISEEGHFPKITIITPSFNQGQYLEQTIRSVLLQGYPNLEYLVIDGGSTDNSVEVIKKYEPWITYWVSEKDNGQSEAINKGLKLATGEIINWLNSDDYYEPESLFKIAKAFTDKNILVVGGRSFLFKGDRQIIKESGGTDVYENNLAKTIGWARIDQPETFFRKAAIEKMGPLDTRLHYLMDRDWWVKYLFKFKLNNIKQIPDILVNFRLHDESKTVSQAEKFQIEHDTYFYALAKEHGLSQVAGAITQVTKVKPEFILGNKITQEKDLVIKVLNYYLLLRANEFYALNKKEKTGFLLNSLNPLELALPDVKLYNKLKWRNRLPLFLINLLRKK